MPAEAAGIRPPPPGFLRHWQRYAAILFLSATFIENLSRTWLKWGDLLVDTGRDLDVARQVSEGRALYSEVRYYFGPFAPWVNAAAFKLFGVHTFVFVALGTVCASLTSIAVYRTSRLFLPRLGAVAVTVSFQYIFAFGNYTPNGIFNFILPYAPAATYGMLLGLGSVFFLIRYIRKLRTADIAFSLALLFLTALTKIELLAAAGAAHLFAQCSIFWLRRGSMARITAAYALCIGLLAGVYGALYLRVGPPLFSDNLFVLLNPGFAHFTLEHMGLLNIGKSLWSIVLSLAAASIVVVTVAAAAMLHRHMSRTTAVRRPGAILGCLCAAVAILVYGWLPIDFTFRLLPPAAIVAIALIFTAGMRGGFTAERTEELTFWTFSLASTGRMALNAVAYHYGFFLLVPGLICFGLLWFRYLPRLVGWQSMGAKLCAAGVFVGVIAAHVSVSNVLYRLRSQPIQTPYAELKVVGFFNGFQRGPCQAEAVRLLSTLPKDSRVLVVPQGLALTFCAGLENPYRSAEYTEAEMSGGYSDAALLARLKASAPDLIVHTPSLRDEFGVFGEDYAQQTWAWILANYEPCVSLGPQNYILMFQRKGAPFPFPDLPHNLRAK